MTAGAGRRRLPPDQRKVSPTGNYTLVVHSDTVTLLDEVGDALAVKLGFQPSRNQTLLFLIHKAHPEEVIKESSEKTTE